jgi:hypothetical protein
MTFLVNTLTRFIAAAALGIAPAGAVASAAAIASAASHSPSAVEQFAKLNGDLHRAHTAGDAAAYLASSVQMQSLLNGSPNSLLQLMLAQSFAGRQTDALRSFEQFIRMGQSSETALQAGYFDALRGAPGYPQLHADMGANTERITVAEEAFRLKPAAMIAEDIDYDPAARLFYVTSVREKRILAVDMGGRATLFAKAPDEWPMVALKIDSRRRILWATEVAFDGFTSVAAKNWGQSEILIYDLDSGKLLHRIPGPPKTALGDMTLDRNGDSIVSDGEHGGLYRVGRKTRRVERIDAGDFISPQTAAMLPDGKHILVPDYVRGLGVLDPATRHVSWIPMQGKYALAGIDGLYVFNGEAIATQNGTSPERVVRFRLNPSMTAVLSESIIERQTSTLGDPTHGVVVDGFFYYIANSGWDALDEHGELKPGSAPSDAIIMRAKL